MKYKAIIIDLDGTAIDSPAQKLASQRLKMAISKLQKIGIKVSAATGRSISFAMPVIESMGLTSPSIVASGTRIIDPLSKAVLWSSDLPAEQVPKILGIVSELEYGFLWNDSHENDYLEGGWSIDRYKNNEPLYFFEICFVPAQEVDQVVGQLSMLKGIAVTVVVAQRPGTFDIHITNQNATKEHAIAELAKIINVEQSEMIGVGDGHNDLHLFAAVGRKVAMENAVEELKTTADQIIGSVAANGLAIYLESLVENKDKKE